MKVTAKRTLVTALSLLMAASIITGYTIYSRLTSETCAELIIYSVRGSGAPPAASGYATLLSSRLEQHYDTAPRIDTNLYPAQQTSSKTYKQSVTIGAKETREWLSMIQKQCPKSDLVLVGHSQGAHVLKQTFENYPFTEQVKAVFLLGDPTRNKGEGLKDYGKGLSGVGHFVSTQGNEKINVSQKWKNRVVNICFHRDTVCNFTNNAALSDDPQETHYEPYLSQKIQKLMADKVLSGKINAIN